MIRFIKGEVAKGTRPAVRCDDHEKSFTGPAFVLSIRGTVYVLCEDCAKSLHRDMDMIIRGWESTPPTS